MNNTPPPYDPIERMIRHTEEYMRKQIERELSLDGIQKRLSQLADTLYLGIICATPFVCIYGLGKAISQKQEQRVLPMLERRENDTNEISRKISFLLYERRFIFPNAHSHGA